MKLRLYYKMKGFMDGPIWDDEPTLQYLQESRIKTGRHGQSEFAWVDVDVVYEKQEDEK